MTPVRLRSLPPPAHPPGQPAFLMARYHGETTVSSPVLFPHAWIWGWGWWGLRLSSQAARATQAWPATPPQGRGWAQTICKWPPSQMVGSKAPGGGLSRVRDRGLGAMRLGHSLAVSHPHLPDSGRSPPNGVPDPHPPDKRLLSNYCGAGGWNRVVSAQRLMPGCGARESCAPGWREDRGEAGQCGWPSLIPSTAFDPVSPPSSNPGAQS